MSFGGTDREAVKGLMVKYLHKKVHTDVAINMLQSGAAPDCPLLCHQLKMAQTCDGNYRRARQRENKLMVTQDKITNLRDRVSEVTKYKQYLQAHRRYMQKDFIETLQKETDETVELEERLESVLDQAEQLFEDGPVGIQEEDEEIIPKLLTQCPHPLSLIPSKGNSSDFPNASPEQL
ncbi:tegument protein UL14 [Testudinid alphaherpesvirus 3]|uniref:Tegument protein UL14 n=1 Tax=Testudinid alphaherpesvirus 3 TaxID=2560801 RepID=A0A0K1R199_9ALPH|nr:tegument protein UL14 [Testudinid alphaherpesvirus 3]AIU39281.1 tegument protein UL14 [Testudinid alphaherpesvirus 3]AIU39391.1 tegument protein UL14 [Testudinid alphaherpesvirus 3]AKI81667.1 tegument protein UL14 [Testudinid alphaherpesvirus 3]AKI81770.1 tegument protein UL14 [Testudinid alphaherpesvirus 3]AKV40685.1 UL14 tegument protein [Testudinid alphaherpesvirus 3]